MSHVSTIEFPTRAALVAALMELRKTPEVESVSVIDLGRTLRVVTTDAPSEASEAPQTPVEPPVAAPVAPAASEPVETPSDTPEADEDDLIGAATPATPKKGRRS